MISDSEVASHLPPADLMEGNPVVQTPDGVVLKSGRKIPCDLLLFALGARVNTSFLPKEWLDKTTGEVLVDQKTLQLLANKDVFCIGDAAKLDGPKRGYFAQKDADVGVANVLQVLNGEQPTHKIQRMTGIMVNLGSSKGQLILPIITFGHWAIRWIKGKDLFTTNAWSSFAKDETCPPI